MFEFRRHPFILIASIACALSLPCHAQEKNNQPHHGKLMGVASCASSNCHGSVTGSATSPILKNEFYTWYKFDKHSKSYNVLFSPESKRIAYLLELGNPEEEKLCLNCHATTGEPRGEKFRLEDGVGCESCHGASENWLASHTEKGATHSNNIAQGMKDLTDLTSRATLCGSCHFGDETKEMTHKLYGAGHPRLSFELDTYEAVEPRHWRIDKDYQERKGAYRSTVGWAQGQLTLAKLQLNALRHHQETNSMFPEFSQFSCFSCHQSMSAKAFMNKERSDSTGFPKINTNHLDVLAIILKGINHPANSAWEESVSTLRGKTSTVDVTNSIQDLIDLLRDIELDPAKIDSQQLMKAIAQYGANHQWIDFQLAEQLVMGVSALNAESQKISKTKISELYRLVESPEKYNSGYLSSALKSIQ